MADVTITPGNIEKVTAGTSTTEVTLETSTTTSGGEVLRSTSLGYVKSDNSSLTSATISGIAMGKGSAEGPVDIFNSPGKVIDIGATLTEGTVYVVSATAGGIAPYADLLTGARAMMIGVGDPNGQLMYYPKDLGVAS